MVTTKRQQRIFNNRDEKGQTIFNYKQPERMEQPEPVNLEKLINDICDEYAQEYGETYKDYFKRCLIIIASDTANIIKYTGRISKDTTQRVDAYEDNIIKCTNNDPNLLLDNKATANPIKTDNLNYRFFDPFAVVCGVFVGLLSYIKPVQYKDFDNLELIFRSLGLDENELIKYFERCGGTIYKKYMVYQKLLFTGGYNNDSYTENEINLLLDYLREREI